jgi:hypothetical protein
MKRILITGMNAGQCVRDYFLKQELQVVASHYALIRCLEDMGYVVEQRPVNLGEDLSSYDDVIVYMHSIQAFCQRLYGGLYAIAARPDCILAFDDWQVDQIYHSFTDYMEDLEKSNIDSDKTGPFREYLVSLYQGHETIEEIKKYKQHYIDACKLALLKKNRLLISAFDHGDLSLLNLGWQEDKVFRFNPNPYHLNRTPMNTYGETGSVFSFIDETINPVDKLREWNFASLVQKKTSKWLKQQNISKWNINYYGARRGEEIKQARLTESDMCRVYTKQWGCLMPGYFHSGSGWWRARPLQVADAGSILICDDREGSVYGEAYVGLTANKIENMNLEELIKTAKDQKECLYAKHPLDKNITKNELQSVFDGTK